MPSSTPIYSAFAIVSIESIWPSAQGDEVPLNYQDLTLLNERIDGGSDEFKARQESLINEKTSKETSLQELAPKLVAEIGGALFNFRRDIVEETVEVDLNSTDTALISTDSFLISSDGIITRIIFVNSFSFTSQVFDKGVVDSVDVLLAQIRQSNKQAVDMLEFLKTTTPSRPERFPENAPSKEAYIALLESSISQTSRLLGLDVYKNTNSISGEIKALASQILDSSAYGTYPQSVRRPEFSSILKNSEDAFKKRRGYFKIIPLNVIQVSTSTSTSGTVGQSAFNVTFTMDDVIIIADEFGANQIRTSLPRAIPIKIDEVFDELNRRMSPETVSQNVKETVGLFGMRAFRISGNDFTFNVEDIVEANDTVTIWLYHDPKEFTFVDNESLVPGKEIINYVFNKDFSHVIGSGSRKSQDDFKLLADGTDEAGNRIIFNKPPRTFVQSIFFKTGILNEFSTPEALSAAPSGEDGESEDEDEDGRQGITPSIQLTNPQVFAFFVELGKEAGINPVYSDATRRSSSANVTNDTLADFKTNLFLDNILTSLEIKGVEYEALSNNTRTRGFSDFLKTTLRTIYLPDLKKYNESRPEGSKISESRNNYSIFSQALINSLDNVLNRYPESPDAQRLAQIWAETNGNVTIQGTNLVSVVSQSEVEDIFSSIILYKKTLETLAEEELTFRREQNATKLVKSAGSDNKPTSGFYNKRTFLSTSSHGETPYLALKGHISSVEVKYGASQGSHTVTINGAGYEKILNENIVYYEDLFSPTGGTFGQAIEAYPIYSQMLPPVGMLSFIESNAPRFILVGKQSKQTLDARNMSLRFARATQADTEESSDAGLLSTPPLPLQNVVEKYFPNNTVLVRGLASIDINIASTNTNSRDFNAENISLRIFYPVNYLNTSRIREMINSLESAYAQNPSEAVIKIPIKLAPMQSISNNLMAFNGPKEVNHLFVDETGRLRQRLAYEAWERPPMPQYTPTITDRDVLAAGSSFSRNSEPVTNMVDIRANYLTTAQGLVDARFSGRTLSGGNDYIPLIVINNENFQNSRLLGGEESNSYEVISEPFFRYGMRYRLLNDVYTTSTKVAKRKSIVYQGFFSKPLKTAKVSLRGNTSYRAGETVLVCLDAYKYRSREIIDINKTLAWLQYINLNKELIPIYIGVDKRWLDHDSYYATVPLDQVKEYSFWLSKFKENPEQFVLDAFIKTLQAGVSDKLTRSGSTSLQFITPEYFPTTFWASEYLTGDFAEGIKNIYDTIFDNIIGGNKPSLSFENTLDYYKYVRMQNFKATSYYIEAVQHSYVHGEQCATTLTLNHGQDNLILLEPFSMKPIGFMSVERKMRIGYDDAVVDKNGNLVFEGSPDKNSKDRLLWEEFPELSGGGFKGKPLEIKNGGKLSDLQKMYTEQYKQDIGFKNNSFLYSAQRYRNSSNFMYELALELGLVK